MTQIEIEEGNVLCAEFINDTDIFVQIPFTYERGAELFGVTINNESDAIDCARNELDQTDSDEFMFEECRFDNDWTRLMTMVRILGDICQKDESEELLDSDEWHAIEDTLPTAVILDAFSAVVEFIKMYNKTKEV